MNDHPSPQPALRHDLYAGIHKTLRHQMASAMSAIGSMSVDDADERGAALAELQALLQTLRLHLAHENRHVHPMLEAASPGSASRIGQEHEEHLAEIETLERMAAQLLAAADDRQAAQAQRLYRHLTSMVAGHLLHMADEEQRHNALLWQHYSDAELLALESRIVADTEPAAMAVVMRWMLPALNHEERRQLLGGMRTAMPAAAFDQVLTLAHRVLTPPAWGRLATALDVPAHPGLVCG